ncbi:MAG: isochorismatase family protein [Roseateles sp.]|uniref:isochorismatase family protein n=1 Tax=Roseateles sp. TaxID=1971397 RepID=UPI0039E7DEAF
MSTAPGRPKAGAIDADASALVLVDYQARLMPAIHDAAAVAAHAVLLARAARLLGIPVLGTEQNPAGLGPTVAPLRAECDSVLAKTHFDACADGLLAALDAAKPGCGEIVIAGCEAHVCMMQTALGLLRAGKRVWVVANASGSRRAGDPAAAMARLAWAGAGIVTHEMVLFEWLDDCRHPRFREVLALVKSAG